MKKLYNGFTEEKWERVRTHPYFKGIREKLLKTADEFIETAPPQMKYSYLHMFETTGDRNNFQRVYFEHERRAKTLYVAYLLTNDEKYIVPLGDILWTICNFESWALSAHVPESASLKDRYEFLELGSCLLAGIIAEIVYVLEDKFPELLVRKVKNELRMRVIEPFKHKDFGWMRSPHNWSAVCIAGILGTYLYAATPEEIDEFIPRMQIASDSYLTGFADEGCCREGYGYWLYGFSYFCIFAEMLKNYTEGRIDYFKLPKVHAVAKFQENMYINQTQCVCFSDCGEHSSAPSHLSHFLKKIYPDVQIPAIPNPSYSDLLTYLLWNEPDFAESRMDPDSVIYSEAQWFIYRSKEYNFACKAGSNNEPHNHNDVGSFLISKDDRVTFCDPGGGMYTRQYFSSERYSVLEPSARSHSLPVINGKVQVTGSQRSTIFVEKENEYAFSMENAYDVETLKSLKRHFVCEKGTILMTDTYEFTEKPESVVERFSTFMEPVIEEGKITAGSSVLYFDNSLVDVKVNTDTVVRSETVQKTLYMIDLVIKNPEKSFKIDFKFV